MGSREGPADPSDRWVGEGCRAESTTGEVEEFEQGSIKVEVPLSGIQLERGRCCLELVHEVCRSILALIGHVSNTPRADGPQVHALDAARYD